VILIAYDGSDDAKAAVEATGRLMGGQAAVVLTVWEPFAMILSHLPVSMGSIGGYGDIGEVDAASRAGAQSQAEEGAQLAQEQGLRGKARAVARVGSVADAILNESDRIDAGAIIMGTRGLGGLGTVLLGSVSHAVVQHADRPVMVVPSPGKASRRAEARGTVKSQ
jgi:nucleotide-binding universal stress UspA family protein